MVLEGLRAQLDRTEHFRGTIKFNGAMETYRRLLDVIYPNLEDLRVGAGLPRQAPLTGSIRSFAATHAQSLAHVIGNGSGHSSTPPVYTFWDSPLSEAPALVQACVAQLRRVYPQTQVLNADSVKARIEVPAQISGLLNQGRPAHYSDYIRTRILEEEGGIWADATLWLPAQLNTGRAGLLRAGTVFPRYSRGVIANWFIASHAHSSILRLQRQSLELWWENYDDLPDYFLYHRIFETLYALVPEFRGQWNAAPRVSATAAHLLQWEMMQPYRPERFQWIMRAAPVQKLSYKYDEVLQGSVLDHLLKTV